MAMEKLKPNDPNQDERLLRECHEDADAFGLGGGG